MIRDNNLNRLQKIINELNDWDALELYPDSNDGGRTYYIPYMMNDALEYYVVLEDCHFVGDYASDYQGETSAELIQNPDKMGLIIRQGDSVSTLWFQVCRIERQCYQYHRIGHFWVQGQEQWRQLVYMIGTMYDKHKYIGDKVCNEKELALLPLMGFPPLLKWYPLNEVPWNLYPHTKEGCKCMKQLALAAGDRHFARLISLYELLPLPQMRNFLGRALTKSSRIPLYNLIYERVCHASEDYPPRDYGEEYNNRVAAKRAEAERTLHKNGFTGNYPYFKKT